MRFRAFPVDWDILFFESFRERKAQNARERSERDANAKRKMRVSKASEMRAQNAHEQSDRVAPQG